MEKIQNLDIPKTLRNIFSSREGKIIVGTILLSAVGIILPRIFHMLIGSSAGVTFLPMHIAVLIAAITLGKFSGSFVALTSIVFSYLLTGMPALARLPYMAIELVIYAFLAEIFSKNFNNYIALIMTMVIGRILYAGILFMATNVFGLVSYGISVIESVKIGIPGMLLQLICVPAIVKIINERLNLKND